jgi:EF hand/EF-hand domain pair
MVRKMFYEAQKVNITARLTTRRADLAQSGAELLVLPCILGKLRPSPAGIGIHCARLYWGRVGPVLGPVLGRVGPVSGRMGAARLMAAAATWRSVSGLLLGLLLALAAAVLSGCSSGSGSPFDSITPIEREFIIAAVTWDLNKDGNVTCDEWKQYVTALFREADADHDGMLTHEEYAALSRRDRLFETVGFKYFDANGDGRISLSEMVDKPNPAFTILDKNHDCILTPDERVQTRGPREDAPQSDGKLPPLGGPGGR